MGDQAEDYVAAAHAAQQEAEAASREWWEARTEYIEAKRALDYATTRFEAAKKRKEEVGEELLRKNVAAREAEARSQPDPVAPSDE